MVNDAKTTCGQHRVVGYYLRQVWLCKACGLPQDQHETISETLARKDIEAQAGQSASSRRELNRDL